MAQSGFLHIKHMLNKKDLESIAVPTLFHADTVSLHTDRFDLGNHQHPPVSARGPDRSKEFVPLFLILDMWNE